MNARGTLSDKQLVAEKVKQVAKSCTNLNELARKLQSHSIQTYGRNATLTGVVLGKRKYRLTTLGITKEHLKLMTIGQRRLDGLALLKENNRTKGLER